MNNDFLSNQLIKLGDMMGDGLHHEEPWIAKEYGKILRKLHPEIFKEKRKAEAIFTNAQMDKLLAEKRCECGGNYKQSRSGSKIAYCAMCNKRVKAVSKKK